MTITKYGLDYTFADGSAAIAKIRVKSTTPALSIGSVSNTAPTGAVNFPISAKVSNHKRQKGLRPTTVVLRATATVGNFSANAYVKLPLLNAAIKAAASEATDSTAVSYGGTTTWKVSYVEDEALK